MIILDHINKLEVIVTYNPTAQAGGGGGMFKSFKNKLFGGSKKDAQTTDSVLIEIF